MWRILPKSLKPRLERTFKYTVALMQLAGALLVTTLFSGTLGLTTEWGLFYIVSAASAVLLAMCVATILALWWGPGLCRQ